MANFEQTIYIYSNPQELNLQKHSDWLEASLSNVTGLLDNTKFVLTNTVPSLDQLVCNYFFVILHTRSSSNRKFGTMRVTPAKVSKLGSLMINEPQSDSWAEMTYHSHDSFKNVLLLAMFHILKYREIRVENQDLEKEFVFGDLTIPEQGNVSFISDEMPYQRSLTSIQSNIIRHLVKGKLVRGAEITQITPCEELAVLTGNVSRVWISSINNVFKSAGIRTAVLNYFNVGYFLDTNGVELAGKKRGNNERRKERYFEQFGEYPVSATLDE